MTKQYEALKNEISVIMKNETDQNSVEKIRSFLTLCEQTLTAEEYAGEKNLFHELSEFLIGDAKMDSLGEEDYYRINADLLRVINKLEGEKEISFKQNYLLSAYGYARKATVIAGESVEENALPIEYLNEAARIYNTMTDEEKQETETCYYMAKILFQLASIWSDFDAMKSLGYFMDMLSVIGEGRLISAADHEEEMGSFVVAANWLCYKVFEMTESPDQCEQIMIMWKEMLGKWLPTIDKYTDRNDKDGTFISALIDAYIILADSESTCDKNGYAYYAKANNIGIKRFADFGDTDLQDIAESYYRMAMTSAGAEEKAALEMAIMSFKLITKFHPEYEEYKEILDELKERRRIREGIYGEVGSTEYICLLNKYIDNWCKGLELNELFEDAADACRFAQAEARKTAERENTDESRRLQYLTAKRFIGFVKENKDELPMKFQLTAAALKNETEQLGESLCIQDEGTERTAQDIEKLMLKARRITAPFIEEDCDPALIFTAGELKILNDFLELYEGAPVSDITEEVKSIALNIMGAALEQWDGDQQAMAANFGDFNDYDTKLALGEYFAKLDKLLRRANAILDLVD